ncbi:MAG: zinc-dependent alcohol dehydrogenase [Bryobacteraceae bacterium]
MRVAELTGPREFRLAERPLEDPPPGQVQVRVQAVGVCGSDMHSYLEGGVGDTACHYPMVLGHEPAGVIVRTGDGVTGIAPGDRAAFEPAIYCYHCEFCMTGRHNVCEKIRFMSMPGDPGFFREFVNLPATNVLPIPPALDMPMASMIEPLAVVLHSMEFASLKPGDTAAVFGGGPIGLLTAVVLKLAGARRVWVVEPLAHRRELALAIGADAVVDPAAVDAGQTLLRETGHRGVDVAFDCAAKGDTLNQTIQVTRNAGRAVFTGIPAELELPLRFHPWRRKEVALYQVRRSNHEGATARDLLAAHTARFAPLITHRRPLEQIAPAFRQIEGYEDGVGKLVIEI